MPRTKGAKEIHPKMIKAVIAVKVIFEDSKPQKILNILESNPAAYGVRNYRFPSLRSIQDILTENQKEIKNRIAEKKPNELDSPWSIGCCAKYYDRIPPERIPLLIKHRNEYKTNPLMDRQDFTIRIAIWIVRLYPIIKAWKLKKDREYKTLRHYAWDYADAERLSEVIGEKVFDTSDLDSQLDGKLYTIDKFIYSMDMELKKEGKTTYAEWKETKTKKDGEK